MIHIEWADEPHIIVKNRRFKPHVRRLKDMKAVLYDQEFAEHADPEMPLYFMYRDISASDADAHKMMKRGIRYDITIIPPNTLGIEFVKTMGHYHPAVPSAPHLTYPEIYEVQSGRAHFLLQRREVSHGVGRREAVKVKKEECREEKEDWQLITDVVLISAEEGEKVVIPPNYGHVTINPADETLCMANFVARHFSSIYEDYLNKRGAAYFELADGKFVKNERYGELPEIRFLNAPDDIIPEMPMYMLKDDDMLDFLVHPERFSDIFERCLSNTKD